ncbi:MAG TPA: hypothetical protein ENJ55_00250, partial [Rhizobiales bacterium]|nr:hypothetical protein [Hyphomicrobiales bacterium]
MAVNPLIVFVGLSVTTLGGLVIVTQQSRQHSADVPVVVQKQQTGIPEPETKPAPVPVISGKAVTKKTAVKKLASLPPKQQPVNPATKTANKLGQIPPAPIPGPAVIVPSFDVVRVEEDGGAVVVGKAAPDTDVVLKLNGKIIGKARANGNGDWVFVPDQLVPKGSHELIVEATGKDKKTIRSKQSIIISMPKDANAKPLIVVSKPDAPSRILQAPETAKKVEAAKPATVVKAVKAADAPRTAPVAAASPATKTTVIAKTSVPVKTTGTKTATKAETASKPAVEEGKPVVKKVASLPTEAPKPVIKTDTATTTARSAAKLSAKPAAKTPGTPS